MSDRLGPTEPPPPATIEVAEVAPGVYRQTRRPPRSTAPAIRPRWALAITLFFSTFLTTTTLGPFWALASRTDIVTSLYPLTSPTTIAAVWGNSFHLRLGLAFSVPVLFILLCHELGHYFACRWYRIAATLPYFIPAPIALGTLGAFIRIRSPIRNKQELFDVGVAGPIAGFVALMPFLVYGIAASQPSAIQTLPIDLLQSGTAAAPSTVLLVPGHSLLFTIITWIFHGPLPAGTVLDLHPFALAAWVGLIATALNLLPLGQLDGGHILYAVAGRRQARIALPIWGVLVVAGLFWTGWMVWAFIVFVLGLRHPPLMDETVQLGRGRRILAGVALVILVLSFMPVPLAEVAVW